MTPALLQALRELSIASVTPSQVAAFRILEAAAEVLDCELGRVPIPGTRPEALRVLASNLALLTDNDVGTTQIPARYDTGDRETLDRIRDLLPGPVGFASGCLFNVVKYLDRAGKKGAADQDEAKALFYLQAAGHALIGLPDPRRRRKTFKPWTPHTTIWPVALHDLLDRLDGVERGMGRTVFARMLTRLYDGGGR